MAFVIIMLMLMLLMFVLMFLLKKIMLIIGKHCFATTIKIVMLCQEQLTMTIITILVLLKFILKDKEIDHIPHT